MTEFIAYRGEKFSIEWYHDINNNCDVLEYFENLPEDLPEDLQIKILSLFKRMGEIGEIKDRTKFNFEGDALYAFKPIPHRFLCFFVKGRKIIVTNAFHKKTSKLPKNEKEKALRRKLDYEKRTKEGIYYHDNI